MNRKYLKIAFAMVVLLLASCSQEDTLSGDSLPEGVYPLEIVSVTMDVSHSQQPWNAPQTRVSENSDGVSSDWEGGETIHVKLGNQETTYEVTDVNGSLNLTGEQLYWTKRTDNVTAWYPKNSTINLANQSDKLAYVLQAKLNNASCDEAVNLSFCHALAKVRVLLTGDKASEVKNVSIKSYTACTHTDGGNVNGESEGEIKMHPVGNNTFEANVVSGKKIAEFKVNGDEWITLSTTVNPEKGKWHKVTIDVKQGLPVITGGTTIDEPGDYIMKGNITESVTLNAKDINLTLDNVQATTDDAPLIIDNNAQVTLNISRTANSLTSRNGNGIEIREGASLSITGNGMSSSKLVVNASEKTDEYTKLRAGIGPSTGNVSIKTINISNVHLVVSGGMAETRNGNGPAAIGLCSVNGTYNQSCEGISITGSKIEATSYGGACIGTGSVSNDRFVGGTYNLGPITITNSEITATTNGRWGDCGSCIGFGYIGWDASGVIERITINNTTLNLTVTNNDAYKVGRGNYVIYDANASYSITNGIIVDGQNKGSEGWNP